MWNQFLVWLTPPEMIGLIIIVAVIMWAVPVNLLQFILESHWRRAACVRVWRFVRLDQVQELLAHPVLTPSAIKSNFFCRVMEILVDGAHPEGTWVTPIGGRTVWRLLSWIFCGCPCRVGILPDIRKVGCIGFDVSGSEIGRGVGGIKKIFGMGVFQRRIRFERTFSIADRNPSYRP